MTPPTDGSVFPGLPIAIAPLVKFLPAAIRFEHGIGPYQLGARSGFVIGAICIALGFVMGRLAARSRNTRAPGDSGPDTLQAQR